MKINEQITTVWQAVNGCNKLPLTVAEQRFYAALETALNQHASDARQEAAALGCLSAEHKVSGSIEMEPRELRKFLRQLVEQWNNRPLSEAEFILFGRLAEALTAFGDEVRLGHPATERRCMICNVPVSRCCC